MTAPSVYRNKTALIERVVSSRDTVLDVGFLGQGITDTDDRWPHAVLLRTAKEVYGVDLSIDRSRFPDVQRYQEASAESFSFPGKKFDVIFAGDLIEHLPNPGLFLRAAADHLVPGGKLILTTPNCFNLFNLTEKITKEEPTVNSDHTCYFNSKTLRVLLRKVDFNVAQTGYVYSLGYTHRESFKKKFLNVVYWILARMTTKYLETLVVVARPRASQSQ